MLHILGNRSTPSNFALKTTPFANTSWNVTRWRVTPLDWCHLQYALLLCIKPQLKHKQFWCTINDEYCIKKLARQVVKPLSLLVYMYIHAPAVAARGNHVSSAGDVDTWASSNKSIRMPTKFENNTMYVVHTLDALVMMIRYSTLHLF